MGCTRLPAPEWCSCAGNVRGAFVPPFVAKAMGGPAEGDADGPLSAKTLQLLAGDRAETCHFQCIDLIHQTGTVYSALFWHAFQYL